VDLRARIQIPLRGIVILLLEGILLQLENIPFFIGFHSHRYQVAQDFFHQQYHPHVYFNQAGILNTAPNIFFLGALLPSNEFKISVESPFSRLKTR